MGSWRRRAWSRDKRQPCSCREMGGSGRYRGNTAACSPLMQDLRACSYIGQTSTATTTLVRPSRVFRHLKRDQTQFHRLFNKGFLKSHDSFRSLALGQVVLMRMKQVTTLQIQL